MAAARAGLASGCFDSPLASPWGAPHEGTLASSSPCQPLACGGSPPRDAGSAVVRGRFTVREAPLSYFSNLEKGVRDFLFLFQDPQRPVVCGCRACVCPCVRVAYAPTGPAAEKQHTLCFGRWPWWDSELAESALGRGLSTARRGPPHPGTWRHGPHPAWQQGPAASFGSTVPRGFTMEFSGRILLAAGLGFPEPAPCRAGGGRTRAGRALSRARRRIPRCVRRVAALPSRLPESQGRAEGRVLQRSLSELSWAHGSWHWKAEHRAGAG